MSERSELNELQFGALHSDDALLDALGGRVPGASMGVAAGVSMSATPDVAARLLAAYAEEIDTRPGPLTELLRTPTTAAAHAGGSLTAIELDAGAEHTPVAATPIGRFRRRRLAMPRTAALVTTGALVLGLGGVAAAVSGNAGPFDNLRRAVSSVTGSSDTSRNPADRAAKLLEAAEEAMNNGDLQGAADKLAQVQQLLPLISDPDIARTLRADLDALRQRWAAIAPALASIMSHGNPDKSTSNSADRSGDGAAPTATYGPPTAPGKVPGTLVPGTSMVNDPTDNLTPVQNSPVGPAKEDLKNKAKQKLGHPLPQQTERPLPAPSDLPAPVGGMRGPTGAEVDKQVPAWFLLYNYGGDALSQPDPTSVAGALTRAGRH